MLALVLFVLGYIVFLMFINEVQPEELNRRPWCAAAVCLFWPVAILIAVALSAWDIFKDWSADG